MKIHLTEKLNRIIFPRLLLNTKVIKAAFLGSLVLLPLNLVTARSVDWGGSVFANNLQSDLVTPLDSAFVFYLGSFGDFTPTNQNLTDWSENFMAIDAVNYKPAYGVFNARHEVTPNDPVGQQGYIWGVRRTRSNMEWILITDPDWTFPSDDDFGAKINWLVGSAAETILGNINGSSYQMVTEAVPDGSPVPIISYELWAKRFFSDVDANAQPLADPNGNDLSNFAEYALDANPRNPTGSLISASVQSSTTAQGKFLGVIVQPSLDANVEVLGWVSPDITFTDDVSAAIIEELPDGSLLIRDAEPLGPANARKFIRIEFREAS